MDALRRRNPFKYSSEPSESHHDTHILDEQGDAATRFRRGARDVDFVIEEQSEIIDNIKTLNAASNSQNRIALQITLALSFLL
jgi:hypothetical protein